MGASVQGNSGYARGWTQLIGKVTMTLSGTHSFYEIGAYNLSAGFLRVAGHCSGGFNVAYGDAYMFWHVWVYDLNLSSYVTTGNSGYIWSSGTSSCGSAWWTRSSSPAMSSAFNSSKFYSTGSTSFKFVAGHVYTFTLFMGCTTEVNVYVGSTGPLVLGASCNSPVTPSRNTFSIYGVSIV